MRSFLKFFALFLVLAGLVLAYSSIFIVDERNSALVVRLGQIQRTETTPGLKFKTPFLDDHIYIPKYVHVKESNNITVQVSGGLQYVVDAVAMYRVTDVKKFRETVQANFQRAEDRIETRLSSAIAQAYSKRTFEAALSRDRAEMMREIREAILNEVLALGIEIVDVRIRRTELSEGVLASTYNRMSAERNAQAAQLRADGFAQKARIVAEAEREAVEIKATAQKESEITRGQGEAERNKTFADAFSKDPEFFAFYRSMQAYPRALDGKDTTLILSPNSEFFRYLKDPGKAKE